MKYDELMDKIEVTDAMRARILRNVSAAAPKKTPVRRYALLAACLAVALLGAVCVPKLMDPAPQGEQVAIANGMIEVADAAALAERLVERRAQHKPNVLDGVMVVHAEIALARQLQIDEGVPGEELQHMVKEADAGVDGVDTRAIEVEAQGDVGLAGGSGEGCGAHGVPR